MLGPNGKRRDAQPGSSAAGPSSKRVKPSSQKACATCRKSKTRCEILNDGTGTGGAAAQDSAGPGQLECHRCKVIGARCSFLDGGSPSTQQQGTTWIYEAGSSVSAVAARDPPSAVLDQSRQTQSDNTPGEVLDGFDGVALRIPIVVPPIANDSPPENQATPLAALWSRPVDKMDGLCGSWPKDRRRLDGTCPSAPRRRRLGCPTTTTTMTRAQLRRLVILRHLAGRDSDRGAAAVPPGRVSCRKIPDKP